MIPMVEQLEALAKQYLQKTRYDARYNISYEITNGERIHFHDNRFPHMSKIGTLRYNGKFVVDSRLIANTRYKKWKPEYTQKECQKPERALKLLVDFVRPLSIIEVSRDARDYLEEGQSSWKSNARRAADDAIRNKLTISKIVEEVRHLVSLGVEFKTDEFRNIVKEGLALYEERERIAKVEMDSNYVHFLPNGRVMVGRYMNKAETQTREYTPDEALPEDISNNLALLKMLGNKEFLPEIGFKKSDIEYMVLTPKNDG